MDPQLTVVPPPPEFDTSPELGSTLGPYKLERVLGEGTMGRVYLGRHQRLGRMVALKVLHAKHTQDATLLQRFLLEARTVNQINHEHIVEVYDFIEEIEPHRVYCVMELLSGQTLSQCIAERALDVETVVRVTKQIATALGAAHAVGVVHRDLKPDNVFLVKKGEQVDYVKVLDFGVAKLLSTEQVAVVDTQNGSVIGTPRYMSPEQAAGLEVDARTDVYALGTVLYELLCGRTPFESQSFGQLAADIITKPPPPLPEKTHGGELIPQSLRELVSSCLAKSPNDRPANMAGVVTWLRQSADTLSLELTDSSLAVRKRRSPVLPLAAAAAVVLGVGAYLLWPKPAAEAPAPAPVAAAALPLPSPPPPPAAPKRVTLSVTTTPPGASVTRGDTNAQLGVTPLATEVEASGTSVAIKLELAGHQTVVREVTLDQNQHLELSLPALHSTRPPREAKPAKKTGAVREGVLDPFGD